MTTDKFEEVAGGEQEQTENPFDKMYADTIEIVLDPYADRFAGINAVLLDDSEGTGKRTSMRFENTIDELLRMYKEKGINLISTVDVIFAEGDEAADQCVHFLNPQHHEIATDDDAVMGFVIQDKLGLSGQKYCAMKENFLEPYHREQLNEKWPDLSDKSDIKPGAPSPGGQ